ncbi:MAG: hypothetical protein U0M42_03245 [Acutalibacteraceae bacterium]|nr:hypothetical protein [Acutalibacteraceae bacterium]
MTDFQRQKQEAENRVRRMNALYRQKAGLDKPTIPQPIKTENTENILKLFRFDAMRGDPDRLLIISVLLLLSGENCDDKLIYALLYIML